MQKDKAMQGIIHLAKWCLNLTVATLTIPYVQGSLSLYVTSFILLEFTADSISSEKHVIVSSKRKKKDLSL